MAEKRVFGKLKENLSHNKSNVKLKNDCKNNLEKKGKKKFMLENKFDKEKENYYRKELISIIKQKLRKIDSSIERSILITYDTLNCSC